MIAFSFSWISGGDFFSNLLQKRLCQRCFDIIEKNADCETKDKVDKALHPCAVDKRKMAVKQSFHTVIEYFLSKINIKGSFSQQFQWFALQLCFLDQPSDDGDDKHSREKRRVFPVRLKDHRLVGGIAQDDQPAKTENTHSDPERFRKTVKGIESKITPECYVKSIAQNNESIAFHIHSVGFLQEFIDESTDPADQKSFWSFAFY